MRRFIVILLACCAGLAWAQQEVSLAGVIESETSLPQNVRVALQVLDDDDAWVHEVASTGSLGGSFELAAEGVPSEHLRAFRSGAVLLPGLQNEYRVSPDDVRYARASLALYADEDGNGAFTRDGSRDPFYLALAQLEDPIGFFTVLYVDGEVTMTAPDVELTLQPGWNVFTVRFPESGPAYEVTTSVDDVALDVLDVVNP